MRDRFQQLDARKQRGDHQATGGRRHAPRTVHASGSSSHYRARSSRTSRREPDEHQVRHDERELCSTGLSGYSVRRRLERARSVRRVPQSDPRLVAAMVDIWAIRLRRQGPDRTRRVVTIPEPSVSRQPARQERAAARSVIGNPIVAGSPHRAPRRWRRGAGAGATSARVFGCDRSSNTRGHGSAATTCPSLQRSALLGRQREPVAQRSPSVENIKPPSETRGDATATRRP